MESDETHERSRRWTRINYLTTKKNYSVNCSSPSVIQSKQTRGDVRLQTRQHQYPTCLAINRNKQHVNSTDTLDASSLQRVQIVNYLIFLRKWVSSNFQRLMGWSWIKPQPFNSTLTRVEQVRLLNLFSSYDLFGLWQNPTLQSKHHWISSNLWILRRVLGVLTWCETHRAKVQQFSDLLSFANFLAICSVTHAVTSSRFRRRYLVSCTNLKSNATQHRNWKKKRSPPQRRALNTEIHQLSTRDVTAQETIKSEPSRPRFGPRSTASVRYTARCPLSRSITLVTFQVIVPSQVGRWIVSRRTIL